jgi:hypothetical protein
MKTSTIWILRLILRGSAGALILVLLLVNPAMAQNTQSITVTFSPTALSEFAVPLPVPGTVGTSFTDYVGPVPYVTGTFYVVTSGKYSATLSANPAIQNAIEILTGVFSPSTSTPTTPLGNFFAVETGGFGPASPSTIPSLTLTAGTEYSYLLVSADPDTETFTLSGPGCIVGLGSSTCTISVPTLSPFAIGALSILLVGLAAFMMVKRASAH